jgi:hypothetical protein
VGAQIPAGAVAFGSISTAGMTSFQKATLRAAIETGELAWMGAVARSGALETAAAAEANGPDQNQTPAKKFAETATINLTMLVATDTYYASGRFKSKIGKQLAKIPRSFNDWLLDQYQKQNLTVQGSAFASGYLQGYTDCCKKMPNAPREFGKAWEYGYYVGYSSKLVEEVLDSTDKF